MKKSKIKGYIKDLENRNKKFSYNKSIKILDISNAVYLDMIKNYDFSTITYYTNSKYLFKEISNELETIYDLLNSDKILMAICLLRNVYEEIMYIIATSSNEKFDINIMTRAGYFNDYVANHCNNLFGDNYDAKEIKELYGYLSKITHVTNIKELVSYLTSNKKTRNYIANEIKFVTLIIENMYLTFLNRKSRSDNNMCANILAVSGYVELLNTIYFVANSTGEYKRIESYFYGEKNKKYLNDQKEMMIKDLNCFKSSKDEIIKSINIIAKELDIQILNNNYTELVNGIFNS